MGDLLAPGNWSPAFPGTGDTAYIRNGGTAELSSGTFQVTTLFAGETGNGHLVVDGGTVLARDLLVMGRTGYQGTATFSAGNITVDQTASVGSDIGSTFTQTGGALAGNYLLVANDAFNPVLGTYNLSGTGSINTAFGQRIGTGADANGYFYQTGGSNTTADLLLGFNYHAHGTYELSGGDLTVNGTLGVSVNQNSSESGIGVFRQSGGTAAVAFMDIGDRGTYEMTGGSMTVGSAFSNVGVLDFKGTSSTINVADGGRVDFSAGTIANAGSASFHVGANSITTVAAGFDPYAVFGNFSTQGIVHTAGTELVIPAGMTFTTQGTIGDHVRVQGDLCATVNTTGLVLDNGLMVDGGTVDVTTPGFITVNVDDTTSGISSGSLAHGQMTVGNKGVGSFHQSGGTISSNVTLGSAASASGSYLLDAGTLSGQIVVGDSGTGTFTQTGGNVSMFIMTVGQLNTGSYTLSGNGSITGARLASTPQYQAEIRVGLQSQGTFKQESGTVAVAGRLTVGARNEGNGT
jgi:hypothetical protein